MFLDIVKVIYCTVYAMEVKPSGKRETEWLWAGRETSFIVNF
jgi:hypothetical protein